MDDDQTASLPRYDHDADRGLWGCPSWGRADSNDDTPRHGHGHTRTNVDSQPNLHAAAYQYADGYLHSYADGYARAN